MIQVENVKCNLCGNIKHKQLPYKHLYKKTLFSLVLCNNCGLMYLTPQPTYNELFNLYSPEYFKKDYKCGSTLSKWSAFEETPEIKEDNLQTIKRIEKMLGKIFQKGKLLEIGCGGAVSKNCSR